MLAMSKTGSRRGMGAALMALMMLVGLAVPASAPAGEAGWTVQFGTPANDRATGVAARGRSVYVAGVTAGSLPGQVSAGAADVFVARFNSRGELRWIRQFCTPGADTTTNGSLQVRDGLVVVGGDTAGTLPEQTSAGGRDAFVRAYDRHGEVRWTVQFGSVADDQVRGVAIARDGSIFVVGDTNGQLPNQTSAGGLDAFVMRLDPDGTVRWLRQFGTPGADTAIGVAVTKGALYVAGATDRAFPGEANLGGFDTFLARLTLDGDFEWITQFGTTGTDAAWKVGVADSTVFVAGHTLGVFPGETALGQSDGFVAAFRRDGQLKWVRQFGTTGCDQMFGLAVDDEGAVVAGDVGGTTMPNQALCQVNPDGSARKYDDDGNVVWTIQLGTPVVDRVNAVALKGDDVYLVGTTAGDLGGPNAGLNDAFVTRIPAPTRPDDDGAGDEDDD